MLTRNPPMFVHHKPLPRYLCTLPSSLPYRLCTMSSSPPWRPPSLSSTLPRYLFTLSSSLPWHLCTLLSSLPCHLLYHGLTSHFFSFSFFPAFVSISVFLSTFEYQMKLILHWMGRPSQCWSEIWAAWEIPIGVQVKPVIMDQPVMKIQLKISTVCQEMCFCVCLMILYCDLTFTYKNFLELTQNLRGWKWQKMQIVKNQNSFTLHG